MPSSTQIPNVIMDCVMPQLPEAEARCLLYICRRTFGFQKETDQISYSQFVDGIKNSNNKILDYGTGLSRQSVSVALKNLISSGAIIQTENPHGNYYKINLEMDCSQVVKRVDQSRELTKSSQVNRPKVVKRVDTQNQEKQRETKKYIVAETATDEKPEFSFKSKMQEMQTSTRRAAQIIALYWDYKGIEFENYDQYQKGYKRELIPANLLTGYSNDRIEGVMAWLNDPANCDFNWKLETIHKLIDQPNLKSFNQKKVIQESQSRY